MSFDSPVFEYEELIDMYQEICTVLEDRPDLLQVFKNLINNDDLNYETESSSEEEEYSDNEVCDETIQVKTDDNGFHSLL
tara:strand:- start:8439 stop:8678 length:240 start_codon:yes stop_codon:yes gene_type:complete